MSYVPATSISSNAALTFPAVDTRSQRLRPLPQSKAARTRVTEVLQHKRPRYFNASEKTACVVLNIQCPASTHQEHPAASPATTLKLTHHLHRTRTLYLIATRPRHKQPVLTPVNTGVTPNNERHSQKCITPPSEASSIGDWLVSLACRARTLAGYSRYAVDRSLTCTEDAGRLLTRELYLTRTLRRLRTAGRKQTLTRDALCLR